MYKTTSKFLQNFIERRGKLPGLQPGTGRSPKNITCPYCNKPFETTESYHYKKACPVLIQNRMEVVKLQKFASANYKQWVNYPCIKCGNPIHINVDWEAPQIICKECIKIKPKHKKNNLQKEKKLQSAEKISTNNPDKKRLGKGFKLGNLIPDEIKERLNVKPDPKS